MNESQVVQLFGMTPQENAPLFNAIEVVNSESDAIWDEFWNSLGEGWTDKIQHPL